VFDATYALGFVSLMCFDFISRFRFLGLLVHTPTHIPTNVIHFFLSLCGDDYWYV
jgi:hypothetical protein